MNDPEAGEGVFDAFVLLGVLANCESCGLRKGGLWANVRGGQIISSRCRIRIS